jgi:hypothetical protein
LIWSFSTDASGDFATSFTAAVAEGATSDRAAASRLTRKVIFMMARLRMDRISLFAL